MFKNGGRPIKKTTLCLAVLLLILPILTGIVSGDAGKQYESSLQCKSCHKQTYKEWNESMHSQAMTDPIFQGALSRQKDKTVCIICHAPTNRFTSSPNLTYLFNWNKIPGNDSVKLIDFLKRNFGITLAKTSKVEKIHNNDTIKISNEKKSVSLTLNNEKTRVNLIIDDVRTDEFIARMEQGMINIYSQPDNLTNEGITCDFCHTISGLNTSNTLQPFQLDPGEVKYGQYADSETSAHKTQYLEILSKSEFCAVCHEMVLPNGVVALGTYTEWKNSYYASNGTQCQDCHMKPNKRTSASISTGSSERNDSSTHGWKGGHFADMVSSAGRLYIDTRTESSRVYIKAVITNERAGHKFPTGDVSLLILNLSAINSSGKMVFQDTKIFSKVYGDANGNVVTGPELATQILNDTRIPPKDNLTTEFVIDLPDYKGYVKITGTLIYRLVPQELASTPDIKITELSKSVKLPGKKGKSTERSIIPGFESVFAVIGIVLIYLAEKRRRRY